MRKLISIIEVGKCPDCKREESPCLQQYDIKKLAESWIKELKKNIKKLSKFRGEAKNMVIMENLANINFINEYILEKLE